MLVANSVMVAPAARVSDVSKVVAPVTSRAPVMFVSVNSSISPVPLASNSKSALVIFVVIVLFLILILSIVVSPVIVGVVICGEVNVSAVLSSPYNSVKFSFIF